MYIDKTCPVSDEDCGIGAGGDEGARVGQDSFGSSPPSFAQVNKVSFGSYFKERSDHHR